MRQTATPETIIIIVHSTYHNILSYQATPRLGLVAHLPTAINALTLVRSQRRHESSKSNPTQLFRTVSTLSKTPNAHTTCLPGNPRMAPSFAVAIPQFIQYLRHQFTQVPCSLQRIRIFYPSPTMLNASQCRGDSKNTVYRT